MNEVFISKHDQFSKNIFIIWTFLRIIFSFIQTLFILNLIYIKAHATVTVLLIKLQGNLWVEFLIINIEREYQCVTKNDVNYYFSFK